VTGGPQSTLRRALNEMATDVTAVNNMRARVAAAQLRRRRRRLVVTAAVLSVLAILTLSIGRASRPQSAPPAHAPRTIDLASTPIGMVKHPQFLVTAPDGRSWTAGADGRVVRNDPQYIKPAGPWLPRFSADGRTVVMVSEVSTSATRRGADRAATRDKTTSRIHLDTFDAPPRTIDHELFGAPIPRYATLSPDGSRVAIFVMPVPSAGYPGGVQLVNVGDGTTRNIEVTGAYQSLNGAFSRDGRRLALISVDGGVAGTIDLASGSLKMHQFGGQVGTLRNEEGWAAGPDADRVVVPTGNSNGPSMLSLRTGRLGPPIERSQGDHLLAWTRGGHLLWGRYDAAGSTYSVRATNLRGTDDRLLYRLKLGFPYQREIFPVTVSPAFRD